MNLRGESTVYRLSVKLTSHLDFSTDVKNTWSCISTLAFTFVTCTGQLNISPSLSAWYFSRLVGWFVLAVSDAKQIKARTFRMPPFHALYKTLIWKEHVFEFCAFLRYHLAYSSNTLPTFRDNVFFCSWISWPFKMGPDRLTRNVGKELLLYAA